jgi:hypothetical protein
MWRDQTELRQVLLDHIPYGRQLFFGKRGCVCVFDYRFVTPEQLEESVLKCSPLLPLNPQVGVAVFMLSAETFPKLQLWEQVKDEARGSQIVPFVEAGYPGPIPLTLVDEIRCIEIDTQEKE